MRVLHMYIHTYIHTDTRTYTWNMNRHGWILVSERGPYGDERSYGTVKGQRAKEDGDGETVDRILCDGSFIIAFSCVVCATVSCSLITMIHSRPYVHISFSLIVIWATMSSLAMINLCTIRSAGVGIDTMHTNPQTSSRGSIGKYK